MTGAGGERGRVGNGGIWAVVVPVGTVIAFVLHRLGLPWVPTWFLCILGAVALTLAVVLWRGARGPDRSPRDRSRPRP